MRLPFVFILLQPYRHAQIRRRFAAPLSSQSKRGVHPQKAREKANIPLRLPRGQSRYPPLFLFPRATRYCPNPLRRCAHSRFLSALFSACKGNMHAQNHDFRPRAKVCFLFRAQALEARPRFFQSRRPRENRNSRACLPHIPSDRDYRQARRADTREIPQRSRLSRA